MKTSFEYFGIEFMSELPKSDRFKELPYQLKQCDSYSFEGSDVVRFYNHEHNEFFDLDCKTGFLERCGNTWPIETESTLEKIYQALDKYQGAKNKSL